MYRIYIQDRDVRLYLMDWIVSIGIDHPQFTTKYDYAMAFKKLDIAMKYHDRLVSLGYEPHIK